MPPFDFDRRELLRAALLTGAAMPLGSLPAFAQSRAETLLVVQELGPNSLDMHGRRLQPDRQRAVLELLRPAADLCGQDAAGRHRQSYDRSTLAPELAESWQVAPDGMSCTFKLRKDATFHDGTPVTAKDVKWSFDRAVKVGGFPTFQMSAGSLLEKPEQFVAVDDHTFRIDYRAQGQDAAVQCRGGRAVRHQFRTREEERDRGRPLGDDLAASNNEAGGGAYKIESWKPGTETIFARFDDWKSGPLPKIRRIIARDIPSAGTRRAHAGDAATPISPPAFRRRISTRCMKEGKVQGRRRADPELPVVRRAQHRKAAVRQRQAAAGRRLGHAL